MANFASNTGQSNTGRLYRTQGNTKGTAKRGSPTAKALSGRTRTFGGSNPDKRSNRP